MMRALLVLGCLLGASACAAPVPPARTFGTATADIPKVVLINGGVSAIATTVTDAFVASASDQFLVHEYVLTEDVDTRGVAAGIAALQPQVIVALGPLAANLAREEFPQVPLVYALMAQDESHPLEGERVLGIGLNLLPSTEFTMYKLVLPNMKKIVAFYTEAEEDLMMQRAKTELSAIGLQLSFVQANLLEDASAGVQTLAEADAAWFYNEPGMMTQRHFAQVLQAANTAKKPLLSSSFRELAVAGAIMAFTLDLDNIGGQATSLVLEILQGGGKATSAQDSLRQPLGGHLVFNEPVAHGLGVDLPPGAAPFVFEVLGRTE